VHLPLSSLPSIGIPPYLTPGARSESSGAAALAAALRSPAGGERPPLRATPLAPSPLRELWLANSRIGDEGAAALACVLAAGAAPELARLSLGGNALGEGAVGALLGARPGLRPDCTSQNPARVGGVCG
jgi:hypothetical protein